MLEHKPRTIRSTQEILRRWGRVKRLERKMGKEGGREGENDRKQSNQMSVLSRWIDSQD